LSCKRDELRSNDRWNHVLCWSLLRLGEMRDSTWPSLGDCVVAVETPNAVVFNESEARRFGSELFEGEGRDPDNRFSVIPIV
jgi:hypothetical protein